MEKPVADAQRPEREDEAEARKPAQYAGAVASETDPAVAQREPVGDDEYVPV
jgi:hypothetical protein